MPASQDLQPALSQFAAKCEAAGMTITTSKSEDKLLVWEKRGLSSPGGRKAHALSGGFLVSGILFTSEGRMEHEIDG